MKTLKTLALAAACLVTLAARAQDLSTAPVQPAHGEVTASGAAADDLRTLGADAEPWRRPRIGLHVGSRHEPARDAHGRKFNNSNPGVYLRWENGVTVGSYRNSEYRTSVYAGWTWANSACGPAVTFGVITGYAKGTIPMIVPSLCVLDHVRLSFIPKIEPKGTNVLHLSLEF